MRELDFNDGFTSATAPDLGFLEADGLKCFASDAAYEADKGSPGDCGNEYFNTTLGKFRYHNGTIWKDLVSATPFYQEMLGGTPNGVLTTFGPLTYLPADTNAILVLVDFIPVNRAGWTYSAGNIIFNPGYIPDTGQQIYVYYTTEGLALPPSPTGIWKPYVITTVPADITAKQITLSPAPLAANGVAVFLEGAPQEYNVDYTISGSILSWNGYALDGFIVSGDKFYLMYTS